MIEIPLTNEPEQLFSIKLNGIVFKFNVKLNSRLGVWFLDISKAGVDIVTGIALVGGVDVFKQFNIGVKNAFIVNIENTRLDPNKENLGEYSKLFIITDEELNGETI